MSPIKVSIAGFTGKTATFLTTELLKDSNIIIHGICRDPSKLPSEIASHPNVKIFTAKVDDAGALRRAVRDTSICVCCYMGDDSVLVEGQKALIDACIAEGVSRYVASDWSFDHRGFKIGDLPMKDFQRHTANYLEENKQRIQAVHILNGAYTEVFWSPFLQVYNPEDKTFRTWGSGDEKLDITSWADAATFTAEVVKDPKSVGWIRVLGDRVSPKEMASIYEEVYAHPLHLKIEGSLEDLVETISDKQQADPHNPFAWYGLQLYYWCLNGKTSLDGLDNHQFETKPLNMKQFFEQNPEESLASLMFKR